MRVVLAALIILAAIAANAGGTARRFPVLAAGGGGGGPTTTLDDDFASDVTGWSNRSGATGCANNPAGELEITGSGACIYSGSSEGTQPTTANQWAVFESGTVGSENRGPGLRALDSAPGGTDYSYVVRCTSNVILIRVCDSDDNCTTIADGSSCEASVGDQMAAMVSGTGASTEICAWSWDSLDTDPSDWADPTTWGSADFCVTDTGSVSALSSYAASATIEDWGTNSNACGGAPTACKGYADGASGSRNVTAYSGSSGDGNFNWFIAGEL